LTDLKIIGRLLLEIIYELTKRVTVKNLLVTVTIVWLLALLIIPKGPRWGNVIDVTEYPLGYSVCVKGHLQSDCYSVSEDVFNHCHENDYWELDHCVWRDWDNRPDPPPPSKGQASNDTPDPGIDQGTQDGAH